MAQCVNSVIVNGVAVLSPVADSPCTSLVVVTPAEYEVMSVSPFKLTIEEGALIASAVLGVWGIAACWRELAAFIGAGNSGEEPR